MNKVIFLDTNILIDFIDQSSDGHTSALELMDILFSHGIRPYISPTTFAITNYFLGKHLNSKKRVKEFATGFFEGFEISTENSEMVFQSIESEFIDLEDGLQYFSALDAGADVIVTKNFFDYYASEIPVIHPIHFVNEFDG